MAADSSLRKDVRPIRRLLVANRGEIAIRIFRACRDAGIETVAVYSDADVDAWHVAMADQAVRLGPAPPAESYLRIDAIVEAARQARADAIHPGYGFLAERASFARAVVDARLRWVGPAAEVIDAVGDKLAARRLARDAGVPTVPGTLQPMAVDRADALPEIIGQAEAIGFPLLVKAAAGGGGRGMRRVASVTDLPLALTAASAEASAAFGDGSVYLEREIRPARHIEVQLLGDQDGAVVALGERDCSIQRRHQKLVEEAPAPGLTADERRHLHDLAVRVGRAAGLTNAATAEFLRGPDGSLHFLEVNTRLQVEHGITELVTGLDLVREQLDLASGAPLSPAVLDAADRAAEPSAHAIEVRLTAEDPARDFAPTPGTLGRWVMPAGPGIRVDTGLRPDDRVAPEYDNLMAKVMATGRNRTLAIDRLRRGLDELEVTGVQTTLPFYRAVVRDPAFAADSLATDWVAEHWDGPSARARAVGEAVRAAAEAAEAGIRRAAPSRGQQGTATSPATAGSTDGRWRAQGRVDAIDRAPR
jgi:acetyl-CoA/propionyl-CoA carboxylase biotin carboxyl carrier protein